MMSGMLDIFLSCPGKWYTASEFSSALDYFKETAKLALPGFRPASPLRSLGMIRHCL